MTSWTVRPIRTGVFEEAEVSFLFYMREEWGRKILAVYWMFLLEDGQHRVLVDTGPASPEFGRQHHHDFTRTPEEEPVAALARLGVRPEQIDLVVNTHLHWDRIADEVRRGVIDDSESDAPDDAEVALLKRAAREAARRRAARRPASVEHPAAS